MTSACSTEAKQLTAPDRSALAPQIEAGMPMVGLEPSCVAVFRDEMIDLLPHDEDAKRLQRQTFTLAEFLEKKAPHYQPPPLQSKGDGAWPLPSESHHGHRSRRRAAAEDGPGRDVLDDGCCGMAGSFGFEPSKYELSMKVGELGVLPKVRATGQDSLILADGFSCKTQIEQATDRHALHLAQVLRMASTPAGAAWRSIRSGGGSSWHGTMDTRANLSPRSGLGIGGLLYWAVAPRQTGGCA